MDITTIVIWAIVIWVVSQILLGAIDAFQIVKLQEKLDVIKHLNNIVHQVRIEENNEIQYWFDEHSEQFLGQGKTLEEVVEVIKHRFPNHLFLIKGKGGLASQTNWKLMSPEEFQNLKIDLDKIKEN